MIITQVELLTELKKVAFARIDRAVSWGKRGVQLVDSAELDDATVAAIGEVSKSADGALRVKFHSKPEALDKIAKLLGMYEHDAKQKGEIKIVIAEREQGL